MIIKNDFSILNTNNNCFFPSEYNFSKPFKLTLTFGELDYEFDKVYKIRYAKNKLYFIIKNNNNFIVEYYIKHPNYLTGYNITV